MAKKRGDGPDREQQHEAKLERMRKQEGLHDLEEKPPEKTRGDPDKQTATDMANGADKD